ncbi:thioredoxin domain-containing protein 16-like [Anneissia japonica]|uniref:thioredoxin domain-containing protein 16-like n=1 Tax=Anneissia japonica TaxID=1529436 RepID=UPI0014258F07|nr:thioredoxin domain-containing protein 16-like [Anneissia japonica]
MNNSILYLLLLVFAVQCCSGQTRTARTTITESVYYDTIASSQVSLVYFYVSSSNDEYMNFLDGFYEASDYLKDFKIKLSVVNCNTAFIQKYCSEKEEILMSKVFVFRNGASLTDLAIDTLFDINSIVSSVLHLVLLQEVPIVQNHQELESLLHTARGKQDVIFSKVMAIGTPEHRAFMEAAFAYGHRYKFLVTTSVRNVLKER